MDPRPDIRLVATDLDGTLLDAEGRLPDGLWALVDDMAAAGAVFVPASGRQYQTLRALFGDRPDMVFIAENGTNVVQDGVAVATEPLGREALPAVLDRVRRARAAGDDVGLVVAGLRSAYVERADDAFVAHVRRYYAALEVVPDLAVAAADDVVLKLAVFDRGAAEERTAPAVRAMGLDADVVVSGADWVDVMRHGVHKGVALRALQDRLGVTADQTVAFGDHHNDAEMLDAATWSYAVANAHPAILARARATAPANTEDGVVRTLREFFPAR